MTLVMVSPQLGLVAKPYFLMVVAFWQTSEVEPLKTVLHGAVLTFDVGITL